MDKVKDFISIIRDGILLCLFVLLIFLPSSLNDMLTKAGFVQGSVMGFTWEDKAMRSKEIADSSQQLATAAAKQMEAMQVRLDSISQKLSELPTVSQTQEVSAITKSIDVSKLQFKQYNAHLKENVQLQHKALDNVFNKPN
jgi:thiamine biosynthesis lipoprotein ApbE